MSTAATAQEYYDLTSYYLQNSLFDTQYDYKVSQTGNVAEEVLEVEGWTAAHTAAYTIAGIYQVGTKTTYNGASIPTRNVEGTAEGGVLALSTGWDQSMILRQQVSLPKGSYKLVSAYYNGDPSKTAGQSLLGWIPSSGTSTMSKVSSFAVGQWITDTLSFTLTATRAGNIQIGFKATSGGSANSAKIAVDYVKLLRDTPYGEVDLDVYKTKLNTLLATAKSQYGTGAKRGSTALKSVMDEAQAVYDSTTSTFGEIDTVYEKLNEAVNTFKALQTADTALKALLNSVKAALDKEEPNEGSSSLRDQYANAEEIYNSSSATAEQLATATAGLQAAYDNYNYSHPTGAIPTVKTDPRFARGATMAFGRLSVTANGAAIKERGFCWAENPEPTIHDNRSSKTLSGSTGSGVNGTIYWLQDLKPATKYYMRAYAITSGYQVAYGEAIKFYTIPKGQINLQMRSGGDQATYNRIKKAAEDAVGYWNDLTEMKGFSPSVGFVDGTPTADCSYGGYIRVGSNTSYQRTGTILHEMLHGVGVIPYNDTEWARFNLRTGVHGSTGTGSGYWLGDRTTEVVRFLQNSSTAQLNGDYQHLWPFGINGANEDTGETVLYIANSLVCQALGEDGLQHTYSLYAEPYYAFDQEDDVRYYIKNESADRGLYTAYLIPTSTGVLRWRDMTVAEAAANDSAAWFITFTPQNQYYQLRNAATGQYITYSSGIKTAAKTTLTANENWHLMKGRVDVDGQRGYWIIHPESNWTPHCLQANANGVTGNTTFNIANSAATQRWLIQSLDEARKAETQAVAQMRSLAEAALTQVKALLDVPHTEDAEDTDQTLKDTLDNLSSRTSEATTTGELSSIATEANDAALLFLQNVTATDASKPFDLTYLLQNPTLDTNSDGWSVAATINYGCAEFFQTTFDFNQTVRQLPAGTYQFCAQGFQRPGTAAASYSAYAAGTNNVNAVIYAGSKSEKLAHIAADAQSKKVGIGNESTASSKFFPNDMQSANAYFQRGFYQNGVVTTVSSNNGSLKVGIRSASMPSNYWAIFDNFRLLYYGKYPAETLDIVTIQPTTAHPDSQSIYTLDGRRIGSDAQLRPGIYVKNGKKVVVR